MMGWSYPAGCTGPPDDDDCPTVRVEVWRARWESRSREGLVRMTVARNYGRSTEDRCLELVRLCSYASGFWSGWLGR